jgi:hypothetical protein
VDAIVSDAKGKQVTDQEAKDFAILQDGKPQKVMHLSYISSPEALNALAAQAGLADRSPLLSARSLRAPER